MNAGTPPGGKWREWVEAKNSKARARNRWRELQVYDATATMSGDMVMFSSNDYLGLSVHPKVKAAAMQAVRRWGAGAGSARLLGGTRPVHAELEDALASWKIAERALVFPSGYAANLGVLSAIAGPGTLVCSDELNHASIVDGCRLARSMGSEVKNYPHCDASAVAGLLEAWPGRAVVVTDAVFSMDGDWAPLEDLARICVAYGALLVVDEAHSVLGPHFRAGAPGPVPLEGEQIVRVGTLSKMLGSQGGFVCAASSMVDLLVNRCRPFIFTTALAPASAAGALAALDVLRSPEGSTLLARLEGHCRTLVPKAEHPSPIVAVMTGSEQAALDAAEALRVKGLYVPAVRPPTVPPGQSRLRISLSAAHTRADVEGLRSALRDLGLLGT